MVVIPDLNSIQFTDDDVIDLPFCRSELVLGKVASIFVKNNNMKTKSSSFSHTGTQCKLLLV